MGWGLVAVQSLSTIKKGTGSFDFQSNELFLIFFFFFFATNGHQRISIRCISGKYDVCVGGGAYLPSNHFES